ncbi:hypothetical protein EV424DRAFT_1059379 [Suillus variegatus]|nr:hypothetical protein EV424DRAFT_1059379 [Suillus variegatus]
MEDANKITVISISKDEPLVGRRGCGAIIVISGAYVSTLVKAKRQCTIMVTMVFIPWAIQILFQGLATAAGYDPITGPGSSCLATTASGQCVFPWSSDIKSVWS